MKHRNHTFVLPYKSTKYSQYTTPFIVEFSMKDKMKASRTEKKK